MPLIVIESADEPAAHAEVGPPVGMAILGSAVGMGVGLGMYWGLSRMFCDHPPCLGGILSGFLVIPVTTAVGALVGAGSKRNPAGALLGSFGGVVGVCTIMYPILRAVERTPGELSEAGGRALLITTVGLLLLGAGAGASYGSIHGWDDDEHEDEADDEASYSLTLRAGLAPLPGGVMVFLGGQL